MLKRGSQLHPKDRREVLDAYLYRMTVESCQRWPDIAAYMRKNGYRMPDRTDAEWLESTDFRVTRSGRLDKRCRQCFTHYGK